jgi:hypothetical protein
MIKLLSYNLGKDLKMHNNNMKYHLLEEMAADYPHRRIKNCPKGYHFESGGRFASDVQVPDPLEFTLWPVNPDSPYDGPEMPIYFDEEIPLFREDLIAAMQEYGVNNVDAYNARIIDLDNGKQYINYKAVNIVGVVATDFELEQQEIPILRRDALFESAGIFVHEKLKDFLIAKGFNTLGFLSFDRPHFNNHTIFNKVIPCYKN